MDFLEYSDYAVMPSGDEINAIRQYNKTDSYTELIQFRHNYRAWLVEIAPYRHVQRTFALRKFGKTKPKECVEMCALASTYLAKPIPEVRNRSTGVPSYQWMRKWIRSELHLMKQSGVEWLQKNAAISTEYYCIPQAHIWTCNLPAWELENAFRDEEGNIHIKSVRVEPDKRIAVALLDSVPEDQEIRSAMVVDNHTLAWDRDRTPEQIMRVLWKYMPQEMEDNIYVKVPPKSPLFPSHNHIKRVPGSTSNVMARWLRTLKRRKEEEKEKNYLKRDRKERKQRNRIMHMSKDDIFRFGPVREPEPEDPSKDKPPKREKKIHQDDIFNL